jgi:hypothetical protein
MALILLLSVAFAVFYIPALQYEIDPPQPPGYPPPTTLPASALSPKPEYTPERVVNIVFEALADNDNPYMNAGVATAWAFVTDEIRSRPQSDFLIIATSGLYYPLYIATSREVSPVSMTDSAAMLDVTVRTQDGETRLYRTFLQRRPDGSNAGCWVIAGILRHEPGVPAPTTLPAPRQGRGIPAYAVPHREAAGQGGPVR